MNRTPRLFAPRAPESKSRALVLCTALLLACLLFPSHARAQTAAPSPSPAPPPAAARRAPVGRIKGRVVGDDGGPLAHVSVYLFNKSWGARARQVPPVNTDEDGKFSFDEIGPGLYSVRTYLPGYTAEMSAEDNPDLNAVRVGDDVTIRLVKGGVLTGTVTDADGEPLVGMSVRVTRLRTLDDRPPVSLDLWYGSQYTTDDRGVYRVYGLPAGVYIVGAGGNQRQPWMPPTLYDADAPTYFRSATLDTAEEVTVRAGQEVNGVDLRYRGDRGHTVSGTLTLPPLKGIEQNVSVSLFHAATGMSAGSAAVREGDAGHSFALEGVADGDYELTAARYTTEGGGDSAPPLRFSVRGADVTGLRLTLAPFGSIAGDLALEPLREVAGECKNVTRRALAAQEVLVTVVREDREPVAADPRRPASQRRIESSPGEDGAFLVRALGQGRYRLDARPADEGWYVRDIQQTSATNSAPTPPPASPSSNAKPPAPRAQPATKNTATNNAARRALDLKPGQQLAGLRIFIAEGAASLAGRVAPREENAPLPPSSRLRVHLVPADREQAEDTLRYYETSPAPDGSFAFKHLAPGRYLLLAREADDAAHAGRPAAWDATAPARLRREAEAADTGVELEPCQRRTDLAARLQPPRD